MYAEVIVDIAHSDVDKIFDYACGEEISAGMRVAVPFGRGVATGFVMRTKEKTDVPPEKLKSVLRADETPALTEEALQLADRIALRYRVPMALVLRLFLPAEMRTGKVSEKTHTVYVLGDDYTPAPRAQKQWQILSFLKENGETAGTVLKEMFGAAALKALEAAGAVKAGVRILGGCNFPMPR